MTTMNNEGPDQGKPAGLWACAECGRKFEPVHAGPAPRSADERARDKADMAAMSRPLPGAGEHMYPSYLEGFKSSQPVASTLLWAEEWARRLSGSTQPEQTAAARDVLAERRRQIEVEGYDTAHDDSHVNDEIAALACFYAMPPGAREWCTDSTGYGDTLGEAILPEGWSANEGDRRVELVKAGALILAEIERLDRAAEKEQPK